MKSSVYWRSLLFCVVLASVIARGVSAFDAYHTTKSGPLITRCRLTSDIQNDKFGQQIATAKCSGLYFQLRDSKHLIQVLEVGSSFGVSGTVSNLRSDRDEYLISQHIVGRLRVDRIDSVNSPSWWLRPANALRRIQSRGLSTLDNDNAALAEGISVGDNRRQSEEVSNRFRASGLSHITVLSGENLAFLMILFSPLFAGIRLARRPFALLVISIFFVTISRGEPSVLRAVVMASAVSIAESQGRTVGAARAVVISLIICVLVDPLLAIRVGFQLSIAACFGMALLTIPIEKRIERFPFHRMIAVSIAAQAGVTIPIAIHFRTVSVAGYLANPFAELAASFVMVWMWTVGIVAGLLASSSLLLHVPTRIATGWLLLLASTFSHIPSVSVGHAAMTVLALVLLRLGWRILRMPSLRTTVASNERTV